MRNPFLKRNNSELLMFRTTFQSFMKTAIKDAIWILWQEVVFSTICAKMTGSDARKVERDFENYVLVSQAEKSSYVNAYDPAA